MRTAEAKELVYQRVRAWFTDANVIFGRQSRIAKPKVPLVSITTGDLNRPRFAATQYAEDGVEIQAYPSRLTLTVDLFTHGSPVVLDGRTVAYEDSAMDDMQAFINYLHSRSTSEWCVEHDIVVQVDGDARDMSGILNEQNYEYRAQITVMVYYTQYVVGKTGVLDEDSLQFEQPKDPSGSGGGTTGPGGEGSGGSTGPGGEGGGSTGPGGEGGGETEPTEPEYGPDPPPKTESVTGAPPSKTPDLLPGTVVIPMVRPDSSGAGSEDLAEEEKDYWYFTSADIQEEKEEE